MGIALLAETVIAQIAAGEVVERPASVVKEMIENALDAGANTILVNIGSGGRALIQVSDDGSGIPSDEVEIALARHATSKLRQTDDLNRLSTLGFRGEALSSIAAVSQLTLTSRHREEQLGTQIRVDGGVITHRSEIGAPAGTVVRVENLFYNTPARLKFLKKESTEKRYITALVTRYAMAYPAVRFSLEHDGREVFRTNGTGQLADVIIKTLGLNNFRLMLEVEAHDPERENRPEVSVYGFTSSPEYHRSDRTQVTLFVNGRWVQDSSLTYAVTQAYNNLITDGRYPISVLMIRLPPHEVDVNVHPTKAEVRFRNANAVFTTVQRAVRQAVLEMVNAPAPDSGYTVRRHDAMMPNSPRSISANKWYSGANQMDLDLTLDNPEVPTTNRRRDDDEHELSHIPEGAGVPAKPRTLPVMRVVGQIGAMYIIAEGPAGMYLVDQNAAHERVIYEQMVDLVSGKGELNIVSLENFTFDGSSAVIRSIELHRDAFSEVGLQIEPFGPNTLAVREIPEILQQSDLERFCSQLIRALQEYPQMSSDEFMQKLIGLIARNTAVRSGQVLKHEQMQDIVRQLERSESPLVCPEGRPTLIHMSGDQLAREFKRRP